MGVGVGLLLVALYNSSGLCHIRHLKPTVMDFEAFCVGNIAFRFRNIY
jgi:hypothetical protein